MSKQSITANFTDASGSNSLTLVGICDGNSCTLRLENDFLHPTSDVSQLWTWEGNLNSFNGSLISPLSDVNYIIAVMVNDEKQLGLMNIKTDGTLSVSVSTLPIVMGGDCGLLGFSVSWILY